MLYLSLYQNSSDLYNLKFVEPHLKSPNQKITFVTPTPIVADDLRKNINRFEGNEVYNSEILTISFYLKNELTKRFPEGFGDLFKTKTDLILSLATVWKRFFVDEGFEAFLRCFKLFTELRGFSLNKDLMTEVLENYDSIQSKAILSFWEVVDNLGYIDEHKSYELLSENMRLVDEELGAFPNVIIFYGFPFLNAGQIDLIKSISLHHEVLIPFPVEVYEQSVNSDWIKWLSDKEVKTINIESSSKEVKRAKEVKIIPFSKGRLSESLGHWLKSDGDKNSRRNIFLGTKTPSLNQLAEIPLANHFFKAKGDIFKGAEKSIFRSIEKIFFPRMEEVNSKKIIGYCEKMAQLHIAEQNFRELKIFLLLKTRISKWVDLSDENTYMSFFDFKIIQYIFSLDLPRVNQAPLLMRENSGSIVGLEGIGSFSPNEKNIFVVNSSYTGLRSSDNQFSESVQEALSSIGPIFRSELNFLLLAKKIEEVIYNPSTVVFLEEGVLEADPNWDIIFSKGKTEKQIQNSQKSNDVKNFFSIDKSLSFQHKQLSATRIQSYIDCPRLFYSKHIEKLPLFVETKTSLREVDLGSIQHKVLEVYFESYTTYHKLEHEKVVRKVLDEYISKNFVNLDKKEYLTSFFEILQHSRNGIKGLENLIHEGEEGSFQFEKDIFQELDGLNLIGSADFFIEDKSLFGILDFKRSSSSIPTKGELLDYKKIQLWYYLNRFLSVDGVNNKTIFMGYLCLKNIEESIIVTNEDDMGEIKSIFPMLGKNSFIALENDFIEKKSEYNRFEQGIIEKILLDEDFPARPISPSACSYCSLNNFCDRGGL